MSAHDNLGDRMKAYEAVEAARAFLPTLPIYARIDGRCFSAFTRKMERPFDRRMSEAMIATTAHLIEETHARIGYTQSDEISLVWQAASPEGETFFAGKIQKMVSVLAGMATAGFARAAYEAGLIEAGTLPPHFDARAFVLPSRTEAANVFLWRELDATKNAISMAARAHHSHKSLHGKSGAEMQEMLFAKGVNFNDYPAFFKRGTFLRRVARARTLTEEERSRIPEAHRPAANDTFLRSSVEALEMPRFSSVANREAVIFEGAEPAKAIEARSGKTAQRA